MKSVLVKKLWNGCVSVRDYIVEDKDRRGKGMVIEYGGKKMTLTPEEVAKGRSIHKIRLNSKFMSRTYGLIDFKWRPDEERAKQWSFLEEEKTKEGTSV